MKACLHAWVHPNGEDVPYGMLSWPLGGSSLNIKFWKREMVTEITLLLQRGWINLWRNKILWAFSFLVLFDPLFRFIVPIPQSENLPSALFFLVLSFAFVYFSFMSYAGVYFVAYCAAIGRPVDFQTSFQASTNLFWKVVGITLLLVLFVSPCLFTVFIFSFREPFQIANLAHNFFFLSIPLSIFVAMWYFPITEIIANNTKIGKSLKTAWTIFTSKFLILAIIGLGLAFASYAINISISIVTMLVQNSFDFAVLSKLDYISPHLSLTGNNYYRLVSTFSQAVWRTYSVSVFTFAYLKYSGIKMSTHSTS